MGNALRLAVLCAAAATSLGVCACSSSRNEGPGPTQSLAAQLNDLRSQYLSGAISREQYETERSGLTGH